MYPFFLTFVLGAGGMIIWSHIMQPYTWQSVRLFFLSIANVEFSGMFSLFFLSFMYFFIPLVVALTVSYFKRNHAKPRFLFALVFAISSGLGAYIVYTLTERSTIVALNSELGSAFMYSYVLIGILAGTAIGCYLAALFGEASYFRAPRAKFWRYMLLGVVFAAILLGLQMGLHQELYQQVSQQPGLRYLESLYGWAGLIAGAIFFIVAVLLIAFIQYSIAREIEMQEQALKERLDQLEHK
ncbi:hypothetical protein [Psittacicella hinzii]|nr:hypothetical protein [Psittacicella hinzii]